MQKTNKYWSSVYSLFVCTQPNFLSQDLFERFSTPRQSSEWPITIFSSLKIKMMTWESSSMWGNLPPPFLCRLVLQIRWVYYTKLSRSKLQWKEKTWKEERSKENITRIKYNIPKIKVYFIEITIEISFFFFVHFLSSF